VEGIVALSSEKLQTLRDLVYLARQAFAVTQELDARFAELAAALRENRYIVWEDPNRAEILGKVASTPDGVYWMALVQEFAQLIGVPLGVPSDPSPLPLPSQPSAPLITDARKIKVLGDLNYRARRDYGIPLGSEMWNRYLSMWEAIRGVQKWSDPQAPKMLGMMALTGDGKYPDNRVILEEYARSIGIPIDLNQPSPTGEAPAPVPNPAPPVVEPAPPVSGDLAAQMREIMTTMGCVFNSEGTLEAHKYKSVGAPEGPSYGYAGVNDGAPRWFGNIREMIRGKWGQRQVDVNNNLPVIMHAWERDGAISWDWRPPIFGEDPNPNPFKTLLIYLAGFKRGGGPRDVPRSDGTRFPVGAIDIGTFEAGRAIRLFVRRAGSTTPDIDVPLQLDGEGISIRVGGQLRRVVVDGDGVLRAGAVVDENA
jgi:hypothetical protein